MSPKRIWGKNLGQAVQDDSLQDFAKAAAIGAEPWKAAGFSEAKVATRVSEAVENLKVQKPQSVVSLVEPPSDRSDIDEDPAPLEHDFFSMIGCSPCNV